MGKIATLLMNIVKAVRGFRSGEVEQNLGEVGQNLGEVGQTSIATATSSESESRPTLPQRQRGASYKNPWKSSEEFTEQDNPDENSDEEWERLQEAPPRGSEDAQPDQTAVTGSRKEHYINYAEIQRDQAKGRGDEYAAARWEANRQEALSDEQEPRDGEAEESGGEERS